MTPEEVAPSYDDLEGPDADDSTAAARPWAAHPEGHDTYREHGHGDPSACQQQNREHAAWWKPLLWPGAWVPIATAGDRAWMLRTGQGARNADYLRL